MRKIVIILSIIFTAFSCGNKYEKAISDYVQNINGSKIDLNFSLKSVKELQNITAKDSLDFITNWRNEAIAQSLEDAKHSLDLYSSDTVLFADAYMEAKQKYEELLNGTPEQTESILSGHIAKYAAMPTDKVINKVIEVVYSIENPFLNNAKQEITEKFVVSADGKICYRKFKN